MFWLSTTLTKFIFTNKIAVFCVVASVGQKKFNDDFKDARHNDFKGCFCLCIITISLIF